MPGLAGLLEPAGRSTVAVYRLHPLLREHCADWWRREDRVRFQRVHRRVAVALARRGETLEGMRHATLAQDPALAGRILVEAGAVQWWLREGSARLIAADRLLPDAAANEPRLAMAALHGPASQGPPARRANAPSPPPRRGGTTPTWK